MTESSGRDLARLALAQARAAAKKRGNAPKPKSVRRRIYRGDGRDPVGVANLLDNWQPGMAGGNIINQWATIAPGLVGKVAPIHYDADHGRLDLRPATNAYATQLRLFANDTAKLINEQLGREAVRTIRVLPVGALPTVRRQEDREAGPEPTTAERPIVRTELPAVVHHARQAMREQRAHTTTTDPRQEQHDRHFATSRGSLREPEPPALEPPAPSRGSNIDRSRQAALAKARAERASQTSPTTLQHTA